MSDTYASGDWHVKEGNEDRFVEAWTAFLQWTRKDHTGLVRAQLMRDDKDPKHFISVAEWSNTGARAAWRESPEFAKMLGVARDLCERFVGLDYTNTVTI
jgi:heme-degrading monooxygenase HmoA